MDFMNFKIGSVLSGVQKFSTTIKTGYITGYKTGYRNDQWGLIYAKVVLINAAEYFNENFGNEVRKRIM